MSWMTLPQAPVSAGESGHLNDHDLIQAALTTLWGSAQETVIDVKAPPYSAKGDGTTDDTAAIQAAINAAGAAGGGVVYFPAGVYLCTPGATTAALTLNNGTTGYSGVRLVGAAYQTSQLRKNGTGVLLAMSGPASDTTGATHCRYSGIENLYLDGHSNAGVLLQTYYADNLLFSNVRFLNNPDIVQDTAEFWDTDYFRCVWDTNGSTTANAATPNIMLRNSAATSGYGYSTDTVNNIRFFGCRWEQPRTGAVWIERGVGTNTGQPYAVFFVACKMESSAINGGPMLFVDTTARHIAAVDLHIFVGGFTAGYSTPQDVIQFGPQFGSLKDVLIFNSSAVACIANGLTLNAPLSKAQVVAENVRGSYTGGVTPTGAHVKFGTNTGGFILRNCQADNGTQFTGNIPAVATNELISAIAGNGLMALVNGAAVTGQTAADFALVEFSAASQAYGAMVAADTWLRWLVTAAGVMSWGSGSGVQDVVLQRSAAGVLSLTSGILDTQHGTKTTTSAAVLTPSFAQGTAAQLSDTTRDYQVYFTVGTAGSVFSVAIGPTSTPANTIVSSNTPNAGESITFRLPAGWFVKWAGTSTTLADQIAIGC